MPINLLSAGGGTTTLTTASSASNFTVTIPAVTGTVVATAPGASGNLLTSNGTDWTSAAPAAPASLSTASGSAPSYSARAWVNFNGTGTPAIRASGNVSSITDGGTGIYTVNITTAMSDTNFAVVVGGRRSSGATFDQNTGGYAVSTSTASIRTADEGPSAVDFEFISVAIFR
jgi:hypothetical protein